MTRGNPCKLYLTYRTEYLMLHGLCVGVRDRRTSAWLPLHAAACAELIGPIRKGATNVVPSTSARPGERLCFSVPARQLVTGPVVAIEEPSQSVMDRAERQWRELFQPCDPNHTRLVLVSQ